MKDTWTRLIEHALLAGGIAEGCTVLRRVGPRFFPGDGGSLPLDSICLHLEKAAEVLLSGNMNKRPYITPYPHLLPFHYISSFCFGYFYGFVGSQFFVNLGSSGVW